MKRKRTGGKRKYIRRNSVLRPEENPAIRILQGQIEEKQAVYRQYEKMIKEAEQAVREAQEKLDRHMERKAQLTKEIDGIIKALEALRGI